MQKSGSFGMRGFGRRAWFQPKMLGGRRPMVIGVKSFATDELRRGLSELFSGGHGDFEISLEFNKNLPPEGYALSGCAEGLKIEGGCESGLLYGVYELLFRLRRGESPEIINVSGSPAVSMRILNHWDNANGSIERGYAGKSLFWRDGRIGYDLERLEGYARLLASVGINQISVNNVNVTRQTAVLLEDKGLDSLVKVAEVFRPFGIRLIIAVHFDSPVWVGGLKTSDPADEKVSAFWNAAAAKVYGRIPDLAGFLIKADSEFQSGPRAFGHTQEVGANVIARALAPFGGTLYWRCFIYNCLQDWRDTVTDRPMAAYDTFFPLDGKFDPNVVLQIKHGPSDFQVREPLSPLLGALSNTREALEFQIAQEYTGQQIDLYAWPVQWEEIFSHPVDETRVLRDLAGNKETGACTEACIEAIVAVSNTGDDDNWCGHLLAQANLYSFGRMAWNPSLTAEEVLSEWTALTFGTKPAVFGPVLKMLMDSRQVYESYNAPLGIGWMVNINHHYGPSVDGYEYMKWGTYHRADSKAIGVDRTRAGTGFTAQYHPYVRALYENACPEEILLYFKRLPYDYKLSCGRTLLQYIYDTHFAGAENVVNFIHIWESLKGELPEEVFSHVHERLAKQLLNAEEWRDVVNTYFYRKTGIGDQQGRRIFE